MHKLGAGTVETEHLTLGGGDTGKYWLHKLVCHKFVASFIIALIEVSQFTALRLTEHKFHSIP